MKGFGITPHTSKNIERILFGDVLLDFLTEYQVELKNIRKVDVHFELEEKETGDLLIECCPIERFVPVYKSIIINMRFGAIIVVFLRKFAFKIEGSNESLRLILIGRVFRPTFTISKKIINFGQLSYGVNYSGIFEVENKSKITFDCIFHFQIDGSFDKRKFKLTSLSSTIPLLGKQKFTVNFIPAELKQYNLSSIMEVLHFPEGLITIPITAKTICPVLQISSPEINLGDIFIGLKNLF